MTDEQLELYRTTEEQLLGALLIAGAEGDTSPIEAVWSIVKSTDFIPSYHQGRHRRIFEGMLAAPQTDQISVADTMWNAGTLQTGDISYMSHLVSTAITSLDYEHFARLVAQHAKEWQTGNTMRYKGAI